METISPKVQTCTYVCDCNPIVSPVRLNPDLPVRANRTGLQTSLKVIKAELKRRRLPRLHYEVFHFPCFLRASNQTGEFASRTIIESSVRNDSRDRTKGSTEYLPMQLYRYQRRPTAMNCGELISRSRVSWRVLPLWPRPNR